MCLKVPPGHGHLNCPLFKLSRELRDMIYHYTLQGNVIVIDLTDHTTFNNARNMDALHRTCSTIRQECDPLVPNRHGVTWCGNNLEIRIPLWQSITWQDYSRAVYRFLLSQSTNAAFSAKLQNDFSTSTSADFSRHPEELLGTARACSRKVPIQSLANKRCWLTIDINLGTMDTSTFAHLHNGFFEARRSAIVHFFLDNLPTSCQTRLIAQARLRNDQVVHLVLNLGNEVLLQPPWPVAADGNPVGPTKDAILKAAQCLNLGHLGQIDEVGIDSRNGCLDLAFYDPRF